MVVDVLAGGVIRLSGNGDVDDRRLLGRRGIVDMVATADSRLLATGRDLVDNVTGDVITPRPEHFRGLNGVGTTLTGDLLVGASTTALWSATTRCRAPSVRSTDRGPTTGWTWWTASPGPTESDH